MSNTPCYRVYFVNLGYWSGHGDRETLDQALKDAQRACFEASIYFYPKSPGEPDLVATWSPIGGTRYCHG